MKSINTKLYISIGLATVIIFGVVGYVFIRQQTREHTQIAFSKAKSYSELIVRATQFNMPIGNRECSHRMMNNVGRQEGVTLVRMYDKKGQIVFSTNKTEIGRLMNMKTESCNDCHQSPEALMDSNAAPRSRIFRQDDHRVLAMTTPIANEPSCYTASCHAHTSEPGLLGILDIGMSLAQVDTEIRRNSLIFSMFTIIAIAVFSAIIAFLIHRLVSRPVKEIVEITRDIAGGNLEVEVPVDSHDEIGQLAVSLNHMVTDLKTANQEIQSWNTQLEQKVRERSEKLRLAREQLVQSEKMASMGVLASSVAHEINNPLQGILTYIKLMLKGLSGEGTVDQKKLDTFRDYLGLMGSEIERCGDMVKNLLVFSKQTKLNLQEAHINNVIENSLQLLENKIKLQGVEVVREFMTDLPATYCDVKQIQQTIMAIIINALEAMPGGGTLTLGSRRIDDDRLEVFITDTGEGIPAETLKNIFDPFFTTKHSVKSTGLGLFVAYGIVKEHKGTIGAESETGRGTTFRITLPLKNET